MAPSLELEPDNGVLVLDAQQRCLEHGELMIQTGGAKVAHGHVLAYGEVHVLLAAGDKEGRPLA